MYLSGGTCVTLIMIGGGSLKAFFQIIITNYYDNNNSSSPLSTVEWYIVFTFAAVMLSQFLPNLNSVARVSLIGAVTAISYCALILAASLLQGRISHPDHQHGTMPSSGKTLSKVPMWRGVQIAYLIIALCLFPLAIGGHWAYGNLTEYGGMLNALYKYHGRETSNIILGSASLLIVINSISSFQIYAMPAFDNLELRYTSKTDKPCPWWLRSGLRLFFGCLTCFIAVALPFLPSLAGLIGGIALPLTLAYPCFMWIAMKKPAKYSGDWCLNWGLGVSGMVFSVLVVAAAIGTIVTKGIEVHFFKP
ncbi:Lysine histidine transporter-like 8 [Linum perenne]